MGSSQVQRCRFLIIIIIIINLMSVSVSILQSSVNQIFTNCYLFYGLLFIVIFRFWLSLPITMTSLFSMLIPILFALHFFKSRDKCCNLCSMWVKELFVFLSVGARSSIEASHNIQCAVIIHFLYFL